MERPLILNRYRPLEEKAQGGFSTVEVAWDTRMQRRVAIKRIPLDDEDISTSQTVLEEARTAALLSNPSIVDVLDFERDANEAFIIMQYVDGPTLTGLIEQEGGMLDIDEAAAIVASVSEALEFAHENQVLHLDVKPDNILIDRSGRVMVTDFGISELASAAGYGTAQGGTIGYMPPEQISGGEMDERTDEWAFAAVVYEMLCGENPFWSSSMKRSLETIENFDIQVPSTYRDDIDPGLDDVIIQALSPDMDERFDCIADFTDSLLPYLGDATAGRKELRRVLSTDEPVDEEAPSGVGLWDRMSQKGRERIGRIVTCAVSVWLAWQSSSVTGFSVAVISAITLCIGLAAFFAPQLGSILALACCVVMLCFQGNFALAAILGILTLTWWVFFGRKSIADAALPLSAPLLCMSWMGAAFPLICGFCLPWKRALVASVFGSMLMLFLAVFTGTEMGACAFLFTGSAGALTPLISLLSQVTTWISIAGWVFTAILMSALCSKASRVLSIIGSALGCLVLLGCQVVNQRITATIWGLPGLGSLLPIGLAFVAMCVITALGAPYRSEEEFEGV